jgi:hypothetical protein
MWGLHWVVVGVALALGTPAVPLAFDGLAPLAVTNGPLGAPLLLAERPRTSMLHLWRHLLLPWPFRSIGSGIQRSSRTPLHPKQRKWRFLFIAMHSKT